jgi:hypothetical protein
MFGGATRLFHYTQDITNSSHFAVKDLPTPVPSPVVNQQQNNLAPTALVQKEEASASSVPEADFYSVVYGIVVDESGRPAPNAEVGIDNTAGIESATRRGQLYITS